MSHEVNLPASVAGANEIKLYLEVSPSSNFDLDNVSLEEADNGGTDDWEEEADARIDLLRKRNLTLEVVMPKGTTYDQLVMEVTQRGHNFPFGTAVKSSRLADCWDAGNGSQPVNDAYCSFVGENFNWIVDEYRMKWKAGEPSQGQIETEVEPMFPFVLRRTFIVCPFQIPDKMLQWVKSTGWPLMYVRGHALLWSIRGNNPDWVQVLQLSSRVEICRDRHDRRSCKILTVSVQNHT